MPPAGFEQNVWTGLGCLRHCERWSGIEIGVGIRIGIVCEGGGGIPLGVLGWRMDMIDARAGLMLMVGLFEKWGGAFWIGVWFLVESLMRKEPGEGRVFHHVEMGNGRI